MIASCQSRAAPANNGLQPTLPDSTRNALNPNVRQTQASHLSGGMNGRRGYVTPRGRRSRDHGLLIVGAATIPESDPCYARPKVSPASSNRARSCARHPRSDAIDPVVRGTHLRGSHDQEAALVWHHSIEGHDRGAVSEGRARAPRVLL